MSADQCRAGKTGSAGKPALGVGAGNVQCILDRGIDISDAIPKIIRGRTFDNGIICSGEQTVIIPEEQFEEVKAEFKRSTYRGSAIS